MREFIKIKKASGGEVAIKSWDVIGLEKPDHGESGTLVRLSSHTEHSTKVIHSSESIDSLMKKLNHDPYATQPAVSAVKAPRKKKAA